VLYASLISCSCSELYCNSSILPIRSRPEAVETNIAGAGVVSKTDRPGHVPQETVSLVALIADKERCPFRLLCVSIPQWSPLEEVRSEAPFSHPTR